MALLWILIIFNTLSCTRTRPAETGDRYTPSTEYVQIENLSGTIFRSKRSTAVIFPRNMKFRFQMEAGEVTLNLEKSYHIPQATHAPIYILQETGIKYRNHTVKESFALYQDLGLGGSILLKVSEDQSSDYQVIGFFSYQGNSYEITPLDDAARRKRDASSHRVEKRALPYGNFYGDELTPPPDTAGLNVPEQYQAPFPSESLRDSNHAPLIPLKEEFPDDTNTDFLPATIRYSEDVDYLLPPGMNRMQTEERRKRRTSDSIYIEYLVISDYKNTENWKSRVGGETEDEILNNAYDAMYQYYQFIINGIDVRFRSATSSGPMIRVVFAGLMVSTSAGTSPWITKNKLSDDSVDDAGCLLDFALWKKATYSLLPRHDHAAMFTGFDLATRSSRSTLGMAYLNSMCSEAWSVSENEEMFNAVTIHIAGHELGHNIGARHDGSGNGCSSNSLYLMAGRLPQVYDSDLAPNPWEFSTCSQLSIQTFIATLGTPSCLYNEPDISDKHDIAGQVYSADEQCNMTYGNDAVLCRDNLFYQWDTICYAMQCKERGQSSCVGRIFPFDGTPCGNRKWCQGGLCVYSEDAPKTHETCIFGDDPHSECDTEIACSESNLFSRHISCCGTCLTTTTTTTTTTITTTSTTSPSSITSSLSTASSTQSTPTATEESSTLNYSSSSTSESFTSKPLTTTASYTQYSTSTITPMSFDSTPLSSTQSPTVSMPSTKLSTIDTPSTNTKSFTHSYTFISSSATKSSDSNSTSPNTKTTSSLETASMSTSPKYSITSSQTPSTTFSLPYTESSSSTSSPTQTSSTRTEITTQQFSIPSTLTTIFTRTFRAETTTLTSIESRSTTVSTSFKSSSAFSSVASSAITPRSTNKNTINTTISSSPTKSSQSTAISPTLSSSTVKETTSSTTTEISTDQDTTISSTPVSGTTYKEQTTTLENSEELSFELQTMISLFLTAAVMI